VDFRPNLFVDIEPFLDHKLRLVDVFASQTVKCPYLEAELLVAMARYWGRLAGCRMVEAMEVLRTVDGGFRDGI
jgi:LmbE family N-acetylglucosaminyl deacetylase